MRIRFIDIVLLTGLGLCASALRANEPAGAQPEQLAVGAGKTRILDMPVNIRRISVASAKTAEAVPVSARSLIVNGKDPGDTSLVVWLADGTRQEYEINVTVANALLEAANDQIKAEFGSDVKLVVEGPSVFVTGRVKNLYAAHRAEAIAKTLGKVVDLLKVDIPDQEPQILLKVRFADVDRTKSSDLGINFFGAPSGFPMAVRTGQYPSSQVKSLATSDGSAGSEFSLSDALNLFLFDSHLNLGATVKALQAHSALQILAEPNVLAMNGKVASFVAGGEFPFPTLQGGGSGVGQITIQFRQFGVQIHFLPHITPRGTIQLHVTPEVSSLDYSNALNVSGYTIPALSTRRVDTEIELENGQSFAIAGLLDNRTTEQLSRIPGLADIPILGKLFTSRATSKTNSELLVIVTPQLVGPIPEGQAVPDLPRDTPFMEGPGILSQPPQTPGPDQTGPPPVKPIRKEIPVEELEQIENQQNPGPGQGGFGAPDSGGFGGPGSAPVPGGGAFPGAGLDTGGNTPAVPFNGVSPVSAGK